MPDNGVGLNTVTISQTFAEPVIRLMGWAVLERDVFLDALEQVPSVEVIFAWKVWAQDRFRRGIWHLRAEVIYSRGDDRD